jgi:porin
MNRRKRGKLSSFCVLIVLSVFYLTTIPSLTCAGTEEITDGPFDGVGATDEVFSPPGLTGDWGGLRSDLAERGVEFSIDLTSTMQSVMSGGFDKTTRFLGSSELIMDIDGEKAGLWPGVFFRVAAQGRFGRNVLSQAGTFMPVNNDALFPSDPDHENGDVLDLTEIMATQFLSDWFGVFVGLLNTASGDANDFAGFARSNEYFQNFAFLASPVSMRLVPNVTFGGGIVLIPFENLVGSVTLMDTEESAGSNPFNTDEGKTIVTEWTLDHSFLDMPMRHVFTFALGYDNDFYKLGDEPRLEYPPEGGLPSLRFSSKDESWAFWYNGQLAFWTHPDDKERQSGLFLRFGYADDETNFIEWNLAGGLGGVGLFDNRPRDRYGIGIFHVEPSDKFPLPQLGIQEETGVEMFYNFQLTPAIFLTLDLQYIDTGLGNGLLVTETPDDAWVGGFRLRFVL